MQGSSQSQLFVGLSIVQAIPCHSESCRIRTCTCTSNLPVRPVSWFGAHVGHSVRGCMISERLWHMPSFGHFISLALEHVPQGGAKCAPITLHCSTIYLRISQLCCSVRSKLNVLMWTRCLLCLWSTGITSKPKALMVADKIPQPERSSRKSGFCSCLHPSARPSKASPPWCALSRSLWRQSSLSC